MRHMLFVVLLFVTATAAVAQPPGAPPGAPGPQGRGEDPPPNFSPAEIQRWFDAYIIVQAQQQLGITDDDYPKVIVRLKALQETKRRSQQSRAMILQNIRQLVGRPRAPVTADEAQIKDRLKALQDLDVRAADELRKAYAAVDEMLSPHQQARFRLFEEEMERRKLELLARARAANRPPLRGRGQF